MHRPSDALRQAMRPSSLVVSLLVLLAVFTAVRSDLAARPIVRLDVKTGGPLAEAPGPAAASAPTDRAAVLSRYRVRPGDTVWGVARLHDVDAGRLVNLNRLAPPYRVRAGDTLRIPAAKRPPTGLDLGSRHAIADLLRASARRHGLPADLLQAVAWRESSWRQGAVSPRGAVGVGQVLPSTAAWVADRLLGEDLDPGRVEDNVRLAAAYLRWLVDRYGGDVAAGLAAYHQGPEAVDADGWYGQTERYVADVFRLRREF